MACFVQEPTASDNHFYKLLIEVLKIETNVLLNDVLRPAADAADISTEVDASAAAYAEHAAASSSARAQSAMVGPDAAAIQFEGMELGSDGAGPSGGSVGEREGELSEGGEGGESGPIEEAHPDAPIFEPPQQQEWVPGKQALGWEAARKAAAAASGSGVQLVSLMPPGRLSH